MIVIYKSYVLPLPQRTKSNAETSHKHDNANDNNHVTKKLKVDHFESNNKESRKRNGHGLSEVSNNIHKYIIIMLVINIFFLINK